MNAIEWFVEGPARVAIEYFPGPDVLAPLAVGLLGFAFILLSFELYERYLDLKVGSS